MNILEKLFNIYEEEASKCTDESWLKCKAALNVPDSSVEAITDSIHNYADECEKTSFATGIYCGIRLMLECTPKGDEHNE